MPIMTITGSQVLIYINNKLYPFAKSINLSVEYGEMPIHGIDSPFPQEIATTRISVRGTVNGLRVSLSGGLQAMNMRPANLIQDIAANPYISIRIQDKKTQEDIVFIPQAKVVKENHVIMAKQTYQLNFDFVGMIPLFALDRS